MKTKPTLWAVIALLACFYAIASAKEPGPVDMGLKDMQGKKVRLRDYRGKIVVLNFWATWCVPCREEMPLFVEMEKAYSGRVVFIAASLDDSKSRPKIPDFLTQFKIEFPVWTGASTMDLEDLRLGAGVPATAFLDPQGRIVARVLGQIPRDELKERLDWLTGDQKGPSPKPVVVHMAGK